MQFIIMHVRSRMPQLPIHMASSNAAKQELALTQAAVVERFPIHFKLCKVSDSLFSSLFYSSHLLARFGFRFELKAAKSSSGFALLLTTSPFTRPSSSLVTINNLTTFWSKPSREVFSTRRLQLLAQHAQLVSSPAFTTRQ